MVENCTLEEEHKPPSMFGINVLSKLLTFKVVPATGNCYGVRHTQAALLFIMIVIAYGMRASLSVTIVAMTDPTATSNPNIPVSNF